MRPRIEDCTDPSRTVHASYHGSTQHTVLCFSRGELRESRSEGEVGRRESQKHSKRHGLTIMELGVWWPSWIVYVGLVPVGEEGASGVE